MGAQFWINIATLVVVLFLPIIGPGWRLIRFLWKADASMSTGSLLGESPMARQMRERRRRIILMVDFAPVILLLLRLGWYALYRQ